MDLAFDRTEILAADTLYRVCESKKKRRKRGILFSSFKQLRRARMGRRKANISSAVVSDTARVLSYNLRNSSEDEPHHILQNEGDATVRYLIV
jgi:hypothetical protein